MAIDVIQSSTTLAGITPKSTVLTCHHCACQYIVHLYGNREVHCMVSGKRRSSPFLKKVSDAIRVRHYSIRTEHTYIDWIKRFILFHDKRHPDKMGGDEVAEFLTYLAVTRHVAPSTQNQHCE